MPKTTKKSDDLNEFLVSKQFLKRSIKKQHKLTQQKFNNNVEDVVSLKDSNELEIAQRTIPKIQRLATFNIKTENDGADVCSGNELRQKLLNVLEKQIENRKKGRDGMLNNFDDALEQFEAQALASKEYEQRFQHIVTSSMKYIRQVSMSIEQRIDELKEIRSSYIKQCEDSEVMKKNQNEELSNEIAEGVKNLQQKLLQDNRRMRADAVRKSLLLAQNTF